MKVKITENCHFGLTIPSPNKAIKSIYLIVKLCATTGSDRDGSPNNESTFAHCFAIQDVRVYFLR